jgi:hypothetical protein
MTHPEAQLLTLLNNRVTVSQRVSCLDRVHPVGVEFTGDIQPKHDQRRGCQLWATSSTGLNKQRALKASMILS